MPRNLKVQLIVALAFALVGASAMSASADDQFHCSVKPCRWTIRQDGTGKTAHHVTIFENETKTETVSFTCEKLSGSAESATELAAEVTLTGLAYSNCTVNGSVGVTVDMNGCVYRFTGFGGRVDAAEIHIECPEEHMIEITYNGCTLMIGPQRQPSIGYHNEGISPNREVTTTMSAVRLPDIVVTGTKAQCLINPEQKLAGTYTTGNMLLTAETTSGAMADGWYD